MLTPQEEQDLTKAVQAAAAAGPSFATMAACEAALESGWVHSELAVADNNLFGCKQHAHPVYGTVHIPTREFIGQRWVTEDAAWVEYPDWPSCFADRMQTLRTLSTTYPHYGVALVCDTPEEYVTEVSRSWSTDPDRATKCIEIFRAHEALLAAALPAGA